MVKKITTIFFSAILAFVLLSGESYAQEYKDFLLKKVGNLYVINVGSNSTVKQNAIYNLYFEKAKKFPLLKFRIGSKREYFGAVQTTQVFPNYSVVRVVSKVMVGDPEGNKIILVPRDLDKQVNPKETAAKQKTKGDLPVSPLREREEPIEYELKDASYKPFSLGLNYFRQLDEMGKPVTESIVNDIQSFIYGDSSVISQSFSSGGGFNVSVSKMLTPYLTVESGFGFINQNSTLNTSRGEGDPPEEGIVSVNKWDLDITNKIKLFTLTLNGSLYRRAVSYFIGMEPDRRLTPRFGLGINYAKVNVEMDQNVTLQLLNAEDQRSLKEKTSLGGYWGWHANLGADYYMQAVRFYADLSLYNWFSDRFKSDLPLRFGASIMF